MRSLLTLTAVILFVPSAAFAQNAEACGVCHSTHLSQWSQSAHSQAWKSERFLAQVQAIGKPEFCASCHAPASVWQEVNLNPQAPAQVEGVEAALPPSVPEFQAILALIPMARKSDWEDGVNCAGCHSIPVFSPAGRGEEFVGPYHATEGHGGKPVDAFVEMRLCGSCHGGDPAHFIPEGVSLPADYHHRAAVPVRFEIDSSDCSGCHMPRKTGRLVQLRSFRQLPQREVGNHAFESGRWEALADAIAFEVAGDRLKITNQKVGHPLQINPGHSYSIQVVTMQGRQEKGRHEEKILGPGKLAMGESMELTLPFAVGADDKVTVRLSLARPDQPAQVVLEKAL